MKRSEMEARIKTQDRLLSKLLTCVSDAYGAAHAGMAYRHVDAVTCGYLLMAEDRLKTALDALHGAGVEEGK